MRKVPVLLVGCFSFLTGIAQTSVGIGTLSPDASARLDITATDKGILVPRVSITNISSASPVSSPAAGLLIWNTNTAIAGGSGVGFYYWDGTQWQSILSDIKGWKLTGNSGINPATQFIGTIDNHPLIIKVNNLLAGTVNDNLHNVFLGIKAGLNTSPTTNSDARSNTFIGDSAGLSNSTGDFNTFVGKEAGLTNSNSKNSFFGHQAGRSNSSGTPNSFFGYQCGYNNTTGDLNSFYGYFAGLENIAGNENSFFGASAGRGDLINGSSGNQNSAFGRIAGESITTGSYNSFFGAMSGNQTTTGSENTFSGDSAGYNNTTGLKNTFIGKEAGFSNMTGIQNNLFGSLSNVSTGNLTNATAIGSNALVSSSNSMVLGSINGINGATADMKVGIGTSTPSFRLHVVNSKTNDGGFQNGILVENTSPIATVGEAAISFKNAAINTNYWVVGINQSLPWLAFNYGTTFAGSTTKVVIDTLGDVGIGNTVPTQKLDVTGNIKINGDITRPSTGGANVVPICYGNITSTGTIDSGTPNFSVTHTNGSGLYTITITGESYSFISYSTVVTTIGLSAVIATTFSSGGSLQVRTFNTGNAATDTDFNFVVYKN